MLSSILGSKEKMGQAFVGTTRVSVTWVKAGPCIVTQIKTHNKEGYWAVQVGFGERKIKSVTKPLQGHLKGAIKDKKAPRFLREIRLEKEPEFKVGDVINIGDVLRKGDVVQITGTSKGKGFAGGVKRWGFAGGPKTHGQSDRERAPGSIGQGTTPGRVFKGKKMAGRLGGDTTTLKNLIVVDIVPDESRVAISGSLPGSTGSLILIKKLSSGNLQELEEEAPPPEVQQVEEDETEEKKEQASPEPEESKKEE